MKKRYILFIYLLSSACICFSQNESDTRTNSNFFSEMSNNSLSTFANYDKKIKGSPYIQKHYSPIKISGFSNNDLSAKYNAHQDFFKIIKNGTVKHFTTNNSQTITFTSNNKSYKSFLFEDKKTFFVLNYEDSNFIVLTKETISLTDAIKPQTGYDSYTPAKFHRKKDRYYMKMKNEDVIKIDRSKKRFLKNFKDKKKLVKKYIKANKLNHKNEKDLIGILKYYYTI
ncbi:hypothetical protein [Tenacibaculum halocynthiae]|uniref:hypothetical protein n=1 Tax=Tenacibaculum halocynthiae TaxID=1254437 RepID=UPI00389641F8